MLRKSIGLCHLAQCLPLTRAPQGMLFSSTPLCLVGFPGTITLGAAGVVAIHAASMSARSCQGFPPIIKA